MSGWGSPGGGSRRGRAAIRQSAIWVLLWLVLGAVAVCAGWQLFVHIPCRIDIDVYRLGAQAWMHGRPLYGDGVTFHTPGGLDLPFTYPPLAAIVFCPFAWLGMPAASFAITCTTLVLLIVSIVIVLVHLDVWAASRVLSGRTWPRRCWLALAMAAAAVLYLEPIKSNFEFGQINVVLMTLVLADCLPRRTPWPRGVLLGLGIALKLTPAVFLLYFWLRRDRRAMLTALGAFGAATLAGFLLAWRDSWEYWTHTVAKTDRIGTPTLNTNQNMAGMLARLGLGKDERFLLWLVGGILVLTLTLWATQRVLQAGEPVLAVICIALFGLVVSPVSWSHHWVWMLPAVLVTAVLAWRRHKSALGVLSVTGVALMVWTPINLMPKHHETTAAWWRQMVGVSYLWWALAALLTAGVAVRACSAAQPAPAPERDPVAAGLSRVR